MARKAEAYIDTSAFIAFVDRSDTYHPLFRSLFAKPPRLVTSTLVIAEGHAWFLRRYDRTRALQFLAFIEDLQPLHVAAIGLPEQAGATRWLRKLSDQDLTLTDAAGLHLMKEYEVTSCWSTDFHLSFTGVPLVTAEY